MMTFWMALIVGAVVALDQWTKFLTVTNINLYERVPVLDGVFHLTQLHNPGAAFSTFEGAQWLFALIFVVLTIALVYELRHQKLGLKPLEWLLIAGIYGGGLGNMIDRIRMGYVVDMIAVEFINFPVFNVADCFITVCGIALVAHLAFCNKDFWKDEKKK